MPPLRLVQNRHDIHSLRTLVAILNAEFYGLAFIQGPITLGLNRGVVYENIFGAFGPRDEAVPFARAEPLDRTLKTFDVHRRLL